MTKDMCEVTYIHEDKVNRAKKDLAKQNPMDVAKVLRLYQMIQELKLLMFCL